MAHFSAVTAKAEISGPRAGPQKIEATQTARDSGNSGKEY